MSRFSRVTRPTLIIDKKRAAENIGSMAEKADRIVELAHRVCAAGNLGFRGILTHAGQSYHTYSRDERRALFEQTAERLGKVRTALLGSGLDHCELSVGDTPTATAVFPLYDDVDEDDADEGEKGGGSPLWGKIDSGSYVRKVSQEHGVAKCSHRFLDSAIDGTGGPISLGRF